ncbi:DUF4097 family beta strand repeat-containing protein [Thermomonospora umbrina]|uniref:Putative adhesin n=1 Tax=Thermomonospora umbrina TaxID=111806 RepID=A0A3D9T020_9ACTN|nr:DUF4097 family beta strand repeat-containing protein [Thermomonospora umbrina]REE98595.1 putative adhesin [Thermomonospora umbrina]
MVNRLKGVAALATGLIGVTAALSGCGSFGVTTYHEDRRYELPGNVASLDVRLDGADIEIVGTDSATISVHERLSWSKEQKPTPTHRREGDTLVLGYKCPEGFTIGFNECAVGYRLQVPRKMAAKVRTDSGNIRVRGTEGDLRAHADAGDIRVSELTGGTISASTDSGNIELTEVRAQRLTAHADAGDLTVRFRKDQPPNVVDLEADSGNIRLWLPTGANYRVDARTQSGTPRVTDIVSDPKSGRSVTARTDAGDITVSGA